MEWIDILLWILGGLGALAIAAAIIILMNTRVQ